MTAEVPRMWDAGVDYLRLTYVARGEEANRVMGRYRTAVAELAHRADPTARTEGWAWLGYAGIKAASASCGIGEQGCIMQVSGGLAHDAALLELPYTGVPRLDLALTVWGIPSPQDIPRYVSRETAEARKGARGRPWQIAFIDGFGAGDTCYIGSRNSNEFVRVYDKAAEAKDALYEGAVRYEAELKGEVAAKAYAQVVSNPATAGTRAAAIVRGILAGRGVALPDWLQVLPQARNVAVREETSVDRSCSWLQQQVAPTVARLMRDGVPYEVLHRILFGQPHSWDIQMLQDVVP